MWQLGSIAGKKLNPKGIKQRAQVRISTQNLYVIYRSEVTAKLPQRDRSGSEDADKQLLYTLPVDDQIQTLSTSCWILAVDSVDLKFLTILF